MRIELHRVLIGVLPAAMIGLAANAAFDPWAPRDIDATSPDVAADPLATPVDVLACGETARTPTCAALLVSRCIRQRKPEFCRAVGLSDLADDIAEGRFSVHAFGGVLPMHRVATKPVPIGQITPQGFPLVPRDHPLAAAIRKPGLDPGSRLYMIDPPLPNRFADCSPTYEAAPGMLTIIVEDWNGPPGAVFLDIVPTPQGWQFQSATMGYPKCEYPEPDPVDEPWYCRIPHCKAGHHIDFDR